MKCLFHTFLRRKASLVLVFSLVWYAGPIRAMILTDEAGRRVVIPDRSERIVSLAPSITEIVFALGAGNRLVGITQFSNYPPEAKRIAKVGSYVHLNIEKILALRPDLVIGIKDGNPRAVVERLSELGVPAFIINPKSLDEILVTIRNIGKVIGADECATSLSNQMARRMSEVDRKVQGAPKPRVFFQIGIEPIVSAGRGTFIDALIQRAGGLNVFGGKSAYPHVNIEHVLISRPEIIFISSMARQGGFEKVRQFWQEWPDIPAVKKDNIYIIDSDILDRPSPRIIEGLETLARLIHPERF